MPASVARSRIRSLDLVRVVDLADVAAQGFEPGSNVAATSIHRFGRSTPLISSWRTFHGSKPLVDQLREVEPVARGRVDRGQRGLAGGEVIGMAR